MINNAVCTASIGPQCTPWAEGTPQRRWGTRPLHQAPSMGSKDPLEEEGPVLAPSDSETASTRQAWLDGGLPGACFGACGRKTDLRPAVEAQCLLQPGR
jgi:hypothetical protein